MGNDVQAHEISFGLLGPVEAWQGDKTLALGPPKRRVLLTRLLIEDGRPVSVDQLCRDLWTAGSRPPGAVSSVHAHISRLRGALEPDRADRERMTLLVRRPAGYALEIPPDALDSAVFNTQLNRARELLNMGQSASARQEIEQALDLWRGPALNDAADYEFAAAEVARLHASRQLAEELRVAILLEEGEAEPAVSLAEKLVVTAPLREASWALLMKSLYATGRSAEALQQYERFRKSLAKDLGVDPGPGLRDLHLAILRHDSAVLGAAARPHRLSAAAPVRGSDNRTPIVGRAEELARLDSLIEKSAAGRVNWAVVTGEAGTGKTRLLEACVRRATERGFTVARLRCFGSVEDGGNVALPGPATRMLGDLRDGKYGPNGTGKDHVPPPSRDQSEEENLSALLNELAARPVLCTVDDLDGSCRACLYLLHQLALVLGTERVTVICAVRDPDGREIGALLGELARRHATRLHLGPLGAEDVAHLLRAVGEPETAAADLHRRTDGNPFLLHELLELPADQRTGPAARIPKAVESIVLSRLEALPRRVRTMVVQAAVSGESLDIEILAHLQQASRGELLPFIDCAVQARILVWEEDEAEKGTGRYRFHGMLRDAVLATLTPASRQLLHAALAAALDSLPGRDPELSARHLLQAGPVVPTEHLACACLRAGRSRVRDGQVEAAAEWFQRAADAVGPDNPSLYQQALRAAQRPWEDPGPPDVPADEAVPNASIAVVRQLRR